MQWIDWLLILIISLSSIIGLMKGFIREAFALAGWLFALFIAKTFYMHLASPLAPYIETPSIRYAVAWLSLLLLTLVFMMLINSMITHLIRKAGLSGMDRMMGVVFGGLRGVLLSSIVIISLQSFTHVDEDRWWKMSPLVPHFETLGHWLYQKADDTFPEILKNFPLKNSD
jgi:membrane protein required for colicin V production